MATIPFNTLQAMFANHIAQGGGQGAYEPQRVNNAVIYLNIPPASADSDMVQEVVLMLSLDSFPLPKWGNGVLETGFLNEKRKFAGAAVFQDMTIVYKDFCDMRTAEILQRWRQQVYDPWTGRIGLARNYKGSGEVLLVSPDGVSFNRSYELIGIWPAEMDPGDIDLNGDDHVRISVTFAVDKAYPVQNLTFQPQRRTADAYPGTVPESIFPSA